MLDWRIDQSKIIQRLVLAIAKIENGFYRLMRELGCTEQHVHVLKQASPDQMVEICVQMLMRWIELRELQNSSCGKDQLKHLVHCAGLWTQSVQDVLSCVCYQNERPLNAPTRPSPVPSPDLSYGPLSYTYHGCLPDLVPVCPAPDVPLVDYHYQNVFHSFWRNTCQFHPVRPRTPGDTSPGPQSGHSDDVNAFPLTDFQPRTPASVLPRPSSGPTSEPSPPPWPASSTPSPSHGPASSAGYIRFPEPLGQNLVPSNELTYSLVPSSSPIVYYYNVFRAPGHYEYVYPTPPQIDLAPPAVDRPPPLIVNEEAGASPTEVDEDEALMSNNYVPFANPVENSM